MTSFGNHGPCDCGRGKVHLEVVTTPGWWARKIHGKVPRTDTYCTGPVRCEWRHTATGRRPYRRMEHNMTEEIAIRRFVVDAIKDNEGGGG
jgi:hypothetical protein